MHSPNQQTCFTNGTVADNHTLYRLHFYLLQETYTCQIKRQTWQEVVMTITKISTIKKPSPGRTKIVKNTMSESNPKFHVYFYRELPFYTFLRRPRVLHTRKFHESMLTAEWAIYNTKRIKKDFYGIYKRCCRKVVHWRESRLKINLLLGWVHEHEHTL